VGVSNDADPFVDVGHDAGFEFFSAGRSRVVANRPGGWIATLVLGLLAAFAVVRLVLRGTDPFLFGSRQI
jgi:hypothetical protein